MSIKGFLLFFIAVPMSFLLAASPKAKPGKMLPDWRKGQMDIHFINSETGECMFIIFPDGTTMVVDAGETVVKSNPKGNTPAYRIYANYIRHFLPATGSDHVDYALLTHMHIDHFGDTRCAGTTADGYAHVGMSALYDEIGFDRIVDRAYPSYGADTTIFFRTQAGKGNTSGCASDWIGFVNHAVRHGCVAERFAIGSDAQFSMCRGGDGKYDFKVLNVVSNGKCLYRNGDGSITTKVARVNSENAASCGVHMKFGNFDFLACGDLTGPPQNLLAGYLKSFSPSIELFKANHHLHHNAWGSGMTKCGFRPDATVSFSWCMTDEKHFPVSMIDKVALLTDLYATSPKSADEYPESYGKMKDYGGHFVARVFKDGRFYIFKLSDDETDFIVKSVHGPYRSRP